MIVCILAKDMNFVYEREFILLSNCGNRKIRLLQLLTRCQNLSGNSQK